ncbi:hypothetical protein NE865_10651 [Phthorimaea operculella]|nr:hypothetical protein NE865_10651 [Phthorimaea operculella]
MLRNINIILIVLGVTIKCNGHGHLKLFDIVGHAHDRIHATVDKVAGGILGGLNLNFQGHIGVNEQRPPPPPQPQPPGEQQTIVVIVKDEDGDHGMRPNQYGQGQYGNNNYNNNPHRPGYNNNQGQWNGNNQDSYGNHNNGQNPYGNQNNCQNTYGCGNPNQGQNHYGNENGYNEQNQHPYQPNHGQNNYHGHQQNQGSGNNYGNGGYNQRPNQNNQGNFQPLPDQPPQGHLENHNGNNNFNQPTTPAQETNPTYGSIHEIPTVNPVSEKTTEKDEPLFVPLNPNEYTYGGDKITINGPKRETDKEKATEDSDDDLPIDIRVSNDE